MKKLLILLLATVAVQLNAQDLAHYKKIVKELSSAKYQGRGYACDGANKAGKFLAKEFAKAGVDEVTCQPFKIDINTLPGKMDIAIDGKKLVPGQDFTLREFTPGLKGEYKLYYIDTANYNANKIFADLALPENKGAFVVCDFWFTYKHSADFKRMQSNAECANGGLIYIWEAPLKYYKAYADRVVDKPMMWVTPDFPTDAKTIKVNIENEFLKDYECFNVIAKVEGRRHDSCYVFTAHYDHLGKLGKKTYFAGAHDNASGTATIVTLAEYYAKNQPEYDMYFIAFSGEDAYLRGSEWYVRNPLVPLTQIKYLFNIDMIGDNNPELYCEVSDEGMAGYAEFEKINNTKGYFKALDRGKLAGNSDHYPFAQRGVPCIFLENKDGDAFKYYHTIYDTWENAIFDSYEPLFRMVTDFVERY
ncbi:MAG: Zn-dependent exopeptidase M28 [Rikenellaceae bacterium]|nr:Zn-dependent exopeptidase M28 [Rikenellaceae bacterium]